MGIVPENEHLPGLEGAGVIRRVGKFGSRFKVGQRVLVYEKGTFANRVQLTPERVYPLPDSMSFEVGNPLDVSLSFISDPETGCCQHAECLSCRDIRSLPSSKYSKGSGKS
jgi:hypothetical protein